MLIIILFSFFYIPSIDFSNNENDLPNEILPGNIDDKTSLVSEIEDLKLEIFKKEQRIKFRDNQIIDLRNETKNLKKSIADLKIEQEIISGNFDNLETSSSQDSSMNQKTIMDLKNKINELTKDISKYKDKINTLNKKIEETISLTDFENINIENSILKTEINLIKKKYNEAQTNNKKLKSLLEEKRGD